MIPNSDYRLWICGEGNAKEKVLDSAKLDGRVIYYGQLPHKDIIRLQKTVTVLINPRTSEGEFSKYSFPSKTLEYMASGTPCILYKLEGIPFEYYEYCYIIEDESITGVKEKIIEVCTKNQIELDEFGKKAANFIFNYKNPSYQVKKIFDMISR
jgi:glycosyltransferase involved in cell wall biosynthesis